MDSADADGITLAQALRNFGCDPAAIPSAAYPPDRLAGYFEAHIEQGPVLESLNLPLGVVTSIVGQSRFWLQFIGHAGHAGAQPMELRAATPSPPPPSLSRRSSKPRGRPAGDASHGRLV